MKVRIGGKYKWIRLLYLTDGGEEPVLNSGFAVEEFEIEFSTGSMVSDSSLVGLLAEIGESVVGESTSAGLASLLSFISVFVTFSSWILAGPGRMKVNLPRCCGRNWNP